MSSRSASIKKRAKQSRAARFEITESETRLPEQDPKLSYGTGNPETPDSLDLSLCDVILVTLCDIKTTEDDISHQARVSLGIALENEQLSVDFRNDNMLVANMMGLSVASKQVHIEAAKTEIRELEAICRERSRRWDSLSACYDHYRLLRNRFLSTFLRMKELSKMSSSDWAIIEGGNERAHGGNAMMDASLYEKDGLRKDPATFVRLYGMLPETVRMISHQETLELLTAHASVVASEKSQASEVFHQQFSAFVDAFQKSGLNADYLSGNPTDLTKAYWTFKTSLTTEVSRRD